MEHQNQQAGQQPQPVAVTRVIAPQKKNALSRVNAFKVARWIDGNQERIRGKLRQEVADMATADLKFSVSVANVSNIAEEIGKPLPKDPRRYTPGNPDSLAKATDQRRKKFNTLGKTTRILARQMLLLMAEVQRVCDLLGEPYDPAGTMDHNLVRKVSHGNYIEGHEEGSDKPE